jgi:hypothetical protein
MPNPTQLIRDASPVEERPVLEGYVATTRTAPTSYTEGVWVVLPEFSTTALIGPLQWGQIHGTAKPKQGARVQVGMDLLTNEPRVLWWEGTYKEPGGGGGAVESVFGRIGKVVAKSGDYTVGEVTNAASKAEVISEEARAKAAEEAIEAEVDLIEEGTTDLTAYLRLLGRSGGQKAIGGTAASNALELESTSNATKGKILFGAYAAFNEEAGISGQRRFGLGTQSPTAQFHQVGESPVEVGTGVGTVPANVFTVTGAKGGNTSIVTTGSGARGAEGIITGGEGGEAPSAATTSGGGAGGKLELIGGKGGKPNSIATETRAGGAGGALTFKSGTGGGAIAGVVEKATGGKAGAITFTGGTGGAASKGTVSTTAGAGGAIEFSAGTGGGATTGTELVGGAGGKFKVQAGNGGAGGGAGGELIFLGGAGNAKGAGGAVAFRGGTSEEGAGGSVVFETGNSSVSTIMQLTAGAAIGFYQATPVTRHAAITAVTSPGAFKKGAQGFETEAEAKAIIEKLEGYTTAINELREAIKKIGITE